MAKQFQEKRKSTSTQIWKNELLKEVVYLHLGEDLM
jgi:hypothetical protein